MGATWRPLDTPIAIRTGAERATLVRRTYGLVFVSVLVTIAGVIFSLSQPALFGWVARHPFLALLATFAPLMAAMSFRDRFPANIGFVFLFTFLEGILISPAIAWYGLRQPGILMQAALLTGSTFGVLTVYAWFSRRDFSAWGSFFMMGFWVLFFTSLLNLFFKNATASLWLSAVAVFVFGGLLVFDTWRLRNVYGPNDYVAAAVNIYLDLLNMFMAVLNLLGGRGRD